MTQHVAGTPYTTEAARTEFDSWSRRYDWDPLQLLFFKPTHRMLLKHVRASDRRLLDVGCGTGVFAQRALEQFSNLHVVGMDLSAGMLRGAEKRVAAARGRLQVVQGDSEVLPFADNAFDVVTCSHSFHHYPNQERVVAEMHRVLRPGGRVLIADGDRDRAWGHFVFDGVVVMMEGAVVHRSAASMRDIYHGAGFGEVHQERRGGVAPFLITLGHAIKPVGVLRRAA